MELLLFATGAGPGPGRRPPPRHLIGVVVFVFVYPRRRAVKNCGLGGRVGNWRRPWKKDLRSGVAS